MKYWQGAHALTNYRRNKLLQRVRLLAPQIATIELRYVYFVDADGTLSADQIDQLKAMLGQGAQPAALPEFSVDFHAWVLPRVGTISPWSTKATDIALICELNFLRRIERGRYIIIKGLTAQQFTPELQQAIFAELHDPMTETATTDPAVFVALFQQQSPQVMATIPVLSQGRETLLQANQSLGLALSDQEIDYLQTAFEKLARDPSDVELMMFAQVNSEHCRHKIFNANWTIDGQKKSQSLFGMIRYTYQQHPENILTAYSDNAAVIRGDVATRLLLNSNTKQYESVEESIPFVFKVETHNHPSAISPFPGAATGSGGEIRDEGATGCGSAPKAGLCGFSVSHLRIPDFGQPWETCIGKPENMASALEIMLEAPIGAASFNNEFGRPNICGYFRTFQMLLVSQYGEIARGYHKPVMIAGGIGTIRETNIKKNKIVAGSPIIVLGGPAMAIGLGGGSASSRHNADEHQALDFASVQRSNPEMQRRAQEVINACTALGKNNPILSIHDVGAGGLSNALPELVHDSDLGGKFQLRQIPNAEPTMSPLAIWCNEAQERYVLAIEPASVERFSEIAARERCPFAIVGEATQEPRLLVEDKHFNNTPVDLAMAVLFDDMPKQECSDTHSAPSHLPFNTSQVELEDAIQRVLQFPCVASKSFLITIGDRSVGGLIARDQMIGPWQVPVADCGVSCQSFFEYTGEALAMGERAPIALLHQAASARMAVGEAITNIAAAAIDDLSDVTLSANWMAAAQYPGEGAGLYDAVQTIAMELCPSLKIAIPVGKDSLSMQTQWQQSGQQKSVTSPLTLIISAAAKVSDVRRTLTPQMSTEGIDSKLLLIDLGKGANLLGASALVQVYNELDDRPPDLDDPRLLANFFKVIQSLNRNGLILAYHDRSDGGLLATICEMMFASHYGVTLTLDELGKDPVASLFAEELGAVIQVKTADLDTVLTTLEGHGLEKYSHIVGELNADDALQICFQSQTLYQNSRTALMRTWSETSFQMQALRDNERCAQQEYAALLEKSDPGLQARVNFSMRDIVYRSDKDAALRPKVAVLREQGVNGHIEMAAAFTRAGFDCFDVHMSDLIAGKVSLADFNGLAVCGGFSYGDVLGAGRGWAQSILMHPEVREAFRAFFHRKDTFTVGMCNGCQMLAYLRELIPGAEHWPYFIDNQSEQFEARLSLVEIPESPSILFRGMSGSVLPVAVSHGEGYARFGNTSELDAAETAKLVAMRYVDHQHQPTEQYPLNPNGSPRGVTALTTKDGRVTIMMPHPERVFRTCQLSWHPDSWGEDSPWMAMFYNARHFVA